MKALTIADLADSREAAFVSEVLTLGPQYAAEAARRSGYGDTVAEAERAAAFLLGATRIQRAITGEIKARFDVAAAAAFNTLLEVCSDPKAPANSRISAAESILNRSSIGPPISRSASVHVGDDTLVELIKKLDEEDRAAQNTVEATARDKGAEEPRDE